MELIFKYRRNHVLAKLKAFEGVEKVDKGEGGSCRHRQKQVFASEAPFPEAAHQNVVYRKELINVAHELRSTTAAMKRARLPFMTLNTVYFGALMRM